MDGLDESPLFKETEIFYVHVDVDGRAAVA